MTQLRRKMLEELQRRNYSEITARKYLQVVTNFAKQFGKSPDKLGPHELRTYQAYLLKGRKLASGTAVNYVAALRFFFVKTLKRHQFRDFFLYPRNRDRLPMVLSISCARASCTARRTCSRQPLCDPFAVPAIRTGRPLQLLNPLGATCDRYSQLPKYHSISIRVCRKRQRLPSSLLP